jgi:hypothetical protein
LDIAGKQEPHWYKVNKDRRVLARESFEVGDGTGFNSTYTYLEVIGIPEEESVNGALFNLKDCDLEVRRYFDSQRLRARTDNRLPGSSTAFRHPAPARSVLKYEYYSCLWV